MGNSKISLSLNINLQKTTYLVRSLCSLHNWLIDKKVGSNIPTSTAKDRLATVSRGGSIINSRNETRNDDLRVLNKYLGGSEHSDDTTSKDREVHRHKLFCLTNANHPRERLLAKIDLLGILQRPKAMGSTTKNKNKIKLYNNNYNT